MIYHIWQGMLTGNFSFLILVFAIIQTVLMVKNMNANKGTREILEDKRELH